MTTIKEIDFKIDVNEFATLYKGQLVLGKVLIDITKLEFTNKATSQGVELENEIRWTVRTFNIDKPYSLLNKINHPVEGKYTDDELNQFLYALQSKP